MTNIKEYLLTLHYSFNINKVEDSHLGNTALKILKYIAVNPSSSIYDCYKYLNNDNSTKIAYKNVHVKVHNLIKLGLIQKVRNQSKKDNENLGRVNEEFIVGKSKHNAIYYSISSAGIFYLVKTDPQKAKKELILKNKNDGFFKCLLYPYIDLETLEKINSEYILSNIFRYLSKCCETIYGPLTILDSIEEEGGELYFLTVTTYLTDPEYDDHSYGSKQFIEYIKNEFNIKWLDVNNTKITEVEKGKLFKISNGKNNELLFELHPERDIAIISERNRKIDEFDIEKWGEWNYNVRHFNPFMVEDYVDKKFDAKKYYVVDNIKAYAHELCHSILERMFNDYQYPLNEDEKIRRRQICKAFSKDKKFQAIAHDVKREFDSSYEHFIRCGKV